MFSANVDIVLEHVVGSNVLEASTRGCGVQVVLCGLLPGRTPRRRGSRVGEGRGDGLGVLGDEDVQDFAGGPLVADLATWVRELEVALQVDGRAKFR